MLYEILGPSIKDVHTILGILTTLQGLSLLQLVVQVSAHVGSSYETILRDLQLTRAVLVVHCCNLAFLCTIKCKSGIFQKYLVS